MTIEDIGLPTDPLAEPQHTAWAIAVKDYLLQLSSILQSHTHTDLIGPPPLLIDGTTITVPPGTPANIDVVPTGVYGEYIVNAEIPQGIQGEVGPIGPPLNILGSLANTSLLPPTANIGDAYGITDPEPDELWAYGSNGWSLVGLVTGVFEHSSLMGLLDDDHTQYLKFVIDVVAPSGTPERDGIIWFVL